ncbi:hypothetical protein ACFV5M_25015 [Streptomyces albidoflavus]
MTGFWGDGGAYGAWVAHLREWGEGGDPDPASLPELRPEDWAEDTWHRLAVHLQEAVAARFDHWSTALTAAAADRAGAGPGAFGRTLAHSRTGLRNLRRFTAHPGLPEHVREELGALVDESITRTQQALEENLDSLAASGVPSTAVELMRRELRDNALTAVLAEERAPAPGRPRRGLLRRRSAEPAPPAPPPDPWGAPPPDGPPRRRIIPG